jgi:glycosyltransferase involved in cell wall biosynthesis
LEEKTAVMNRMSNPLISVVIPAFNEESSLGDVLAAVGMTAALDALSFEIIVVDDGSTDKTEKIANGYDVYVLHNDKNRGKGWALQQGFRKAQGDIIVTMDADGSHDPRDIRKLVLPILNGADIVVGSRFASGQGKDSTKRLHIIGNILINFSIFLMTGKKLTDSQTGFRAFKRKVIQDIELDSTGYQVETEFTMKTLRNDNIVKEVPIRIRGRKNGISRLNPILDGVRILTTILRTSAEQQRSAGAR